MVGLLQIMIYLFCIYLVYKGIEIYQIAYVSVNQFTRQTGLIIGIVLIIVAILASIGAIWLTDDMVSKISNTNFPTLK